jgi:hypothetical protein
MKEGKENRKRDSASKTIINVKENTTTTGSASGLCLCSEIRDCMSQCRQGWHKGVSAPGISASGCTLPQSDPPAACAFHCQHLPALLSGVCNSEAAAAMPD